MVATEHKGRPSAQLQPAEKPAVVLPSKVRLIAPHGFIAADGRRHHWGAGHVVTDAADIKILTDRKAPIEPLV